MSIDTLEQMKLKAWLSGAQAGGEIAPLETSVERLHGYQAVAAEMGAATYNEGVERYAGLVGNYVRELMEASATVKRVISQVSDTTQRRILEYRYLDGMTVEAIADIMNYSTASVIRHHRAALSSVRDILNASAADE